VVKVLVGSQIRIPLIIIRIMEVMENWPRIEVIKAEEEIQILIRKIYNCYDCKK